MLEEVANLLHSDTDTIATMAGALIGALDTDLPPTEAIQDGAFIEREAARRVEHRTEARNHYEGQSQDAAGSATLERMTDSAIRSGFDPMLIGSHLLSLAEKDQGIEMAVAYTAIIVKARHARLKRS